jgi:phospholipase C
VNVQIFGNQQGTDDGTPKMQGFIKAYFEKRNDVDHSRLIMNCFRPSDVPVITTLAKEFAVCDRWFSSLPGPTIPNRLFVHFGETFGRVDNALQFNDNGRSIYARMLNAGRSARVYYFDETSASIGFTFLLTNQPQTFGDWNQFVKDCHDGTLPDYSFVEPNYSDHDNMLASDQHPDHNVLAGERFIAGVYNEIRKNQALWESTLLLIVYDEHGGIFDHVQPPAIPPDGVIDPVSGFKFDRLGIRVPAVFVSPWIPKEDPKTNTVIHQQYEHASIPASVASFFIADPKQRNLTVREQRARLFTDEAASILTLDQPRTDEFYFSLDAPQNTIMSNIAAPAISQKARSIAVGVPPASAYNPDREISLLLRDQVWHLAEQEKQLPPELRTNIPIRSIHTERQAGEYSKKVLAALRTHLAKKAGAQQ